MAKHLVKNIKREEPEKKDMIEYLMSGDSIMTEGGLVDFMIYYGVIKGEVSDEERASVFSN